MPVRHAAVLDPPPIRVPDEPSDTVMRKPIRERQPGMYVNRKRGMRRLHEVTPSDAPDLSGEILLPRERSPAPFAVGKDALQALLPAQRHVLDDGIAQHDIERVIGEGKRCIRIQLDGLESVAFACE